MGAESSRELRSASVIADAAKAAGGRRGFSCLPLVVSAAFFLSGCVTYIPVDEYALARAAYESARDADAARFAPALWFDAELDYREAGKAFTERHYDEARNRFIQARNLAEQAENVARLARHESGELIP